MSAASVAIVVTVAILFAGRAIAIQRERNAIGTIAPEVSPLKTQGVVLQRAAAQAGNVLPLYGSSELLRPPFWRAPDFFRTAPSGFQVSAAGKAGATSLTMLQKIGALNRELREKRVAVLLSSVWFVGRTTFYWYDGNFSRFAASALIFDSSLDFQLKRDIAARMIQYPRRLDKTPLLAFALRRLASGKPLDRLAFCVIWPLGKMEDIILNLQDHSAALAALRGRGSLPRLGPQKLDWAALITKAEQITVARNRDKHTQTETAGHRVTGSGDAGFHERMDGAMEWVDLELLLRTLKEIRARPLLMSMPMNGPYYDTLGISPVARQEYYNKLTALVRRYGFELVDFADHDEDPNFLEPHLTAKGWILFDRVIDDFMHDRVPRT
jgi:D-alanine transfer protein